MTMPIQNVIVNCTDVPRSVDFYTRLLQAEVVGEPTADRALLDFVTATVELRRVDGRGREHLDRPTTCSWAQRTSASRWTEVDQRAELLKRADVPFHLDPLDAEGAVRICFFYDPDGTLLEFVAGRPAVREHRSIPTAWPRSERSASRPVPASTTSR